ncbi:MAG TPA: YdeI/OmpD-associated family protein [Bacteroidales bacterium]|nr:YdeI/OmpD-associated family protein [Bacteroidales bacterium]
MAGPHKLKYKAIIIQHEGMDAAFVEFPFDVEEIFGRKGKLKVKALFDGKVLYRGSLFNMGKKSHVIGLTKETRKQIDKTFGDEVLVEIEEDTDKREVVIPEDVMSLFGKNPEAKEFYESLSFTDRKEYMGWIEAAKRMETRNNRLGLFIEKLNNRSKLHDK